MTVLRPDVPGHPLGVDRREPHGDRVRPRSRAPESSDVLLLVVAIGGGGWLRFVGTDEGDHHLQRAYVHGATPRRRPWRAWNRDCQPDVSSWSQWSSPCPPSPVTATVVNAYDLAGHTAGSATTNDTGRYSIRLGTGWASRLRVATAGPFPHCPDTPVTVTGEAPVTADIDCDTDPLTSGDERSAGQCGTG